ncbi:aminotransferase class IV [Pelovirga terrestris]|uniref:branched-chain-amino-acid transaminase n=1 Tax=Pelovirga terrestris TaxID=2771352 RepID=A0A8J6UHI3_9BACT|nr:aminotransferase class IV [Pelovirga terrestris]MBD1399360.1 aminotransferase class IV [Pelovirga terrestris]
MLTCLNGQFISQEEARVAVNDGAFLYGDSLFETIKARRQQILLLDQHLDRIEQSAQLLEFPCPRSAIATAIRQLSMRLTAAASRIRLTLSRGSYQGLVRPAHKQGWFLLTAVSYNEMDEPRRVQGFNCCLAPNQRVNPFSHLPQLKLGNYADCLYARNHARQQEVEEALFLDRNGNLLEGATSNIFAIIDNQLVTPPLGNLVLNGIMRHQVIDAAGELGILCGESSLPLADAIKATEVFICNSLIDLVPVNTIDGKSINRGRLWKDIYKRISLRIDP